MEKNIFLIETDTCYGIACPLADINAYHEIYDIKKRPLTKPLAILVPDYDWLLEHTSLEESDIAFLKKYPHPYSVITDSEPLEVLMRMSIEDDTGNILQFDNPSVYDGFSFRVAHTKKQKNLIDQVGPLWLTSANISGQEEIYDFDALQSTFEKYENLIEMRVNPNVKHIPKNPPSDIFYFTDDDQVEYIRKNYET